MFSFFKRNDSKTDDDLKKDYLEVGGRFGDAVSYLYMGECVGFKEMLDRLISIEEDWVERGFRPISIDAFELYGGRGREIEDFGAKLEEDEEPRFHAKIYKEKFLGKVQPAVDLEALMNGGGPQFGNFSSPSTEVDEEG